VAFAIRSAGVDEVDALLPMYEWLFDGPARRPPGWDLGRAGAALREAILADSSVVRVADATGALIGICSSYLDYTSASGSFA
jgi:hypothetical protein